jgi:hypothetical protein
VQPPSWPAATKRHDATTQDCSHVGGAQLVMLHCKQLAQTMQPPAWPKSAKRHNASTNGWCWWAGAVLPLLLPPRLWPEPNKRQNTAIKDPLPRLNSILSHDYVVTCTTYLRYIASILCPARCCKPCRRRPGQNPPNGTTPPPRDPPNHPPAGRGGLAPFCPCCCLHASTCSGVYWP